MYMHMINTDVTCEHRTKLVLIDVAITLVVFCIAVKLKHVKHQLTYLSHPIQWGTE